jgi:hypothetical protein
MDLPAASSHLNTACTGPSDGGAGGAPGGSTVAAAAAAAATSAGDTPSGGQQVVAKLLISNAAAGSVIGKVRGAGAAQRAGGCGGVRAASSAAFRAPTRDPGRAPAPARPSPRPAHPRPGGPDDRADPEEQWRTRAAVARGRVLPWHLGARAAAVGPAALGADRGFPDAGEAAAGAQQPLRGGGRGPGAASGWLQQEGAGKRARCVLWFGAAGAPCAPPRPRAQVHSLAPGTPPSRPPPRSSSPCPASCAARSSGRRARRSATSCRTAARRSACRWGLGGGGAPLPFRPSVLSTVCLLARIILRPSPLDAPTPSSP